jgi:hypothetical protein
LYFQRLCITFWLVCILKCYSNPTVFLGGASVRRAHWTKYDRHKQRTNGRRVSNCVRNGKCRHATIRADQVNHRGHWVCHFFVLKCLFDKLTCLKVVFLCRIHGLISSCLQGRSNTNRQYIFVNNRPCHFKQVCHTYIEFSIT